MQEFALESDTQRAGLELAAKGPLQGAAIYAPSRLRFAILATLCMGLYDVYWGYRNWRAVRESSGEDVWPFWRGVFLVFTFHGLLERLQAGQRRAGLSTTLAVSSLAWTYILLVFCDRLIDRLSPTVLAEGWGWALSFGVVCLRWLPLLPANDALRELRRTTAPYAPPEGWSVPSVALAGFGILLIVTFVVGLSTPPTRVLAAGDIPNSYARDLLKEGVLEPGEEMLFFYGAGLSLMEDGNILTTRRLISYASESGELYSFNEMPIAEVRSWELAKGSLIEDSVLTVTSHTGDAIHLLLSVEGGGDDEFVERLEKLVEERVVVDAAKTESSYRDHDGDRCQVGFRSRETSRKEAT